MLLLLTEYFKQVLSIRIFLVSRFAPIKIGVHVSVYVFVCLCMHVGVQEIDIFNIKERNINNDTEYIWIEYPVDR